MHGLPQILLHSKALAQLPATGQRRDILLKRLRHIQVTPEHGGDFHWPEISSPNSVQVSVVVGYAITWMIQNDHICVLDIKGQ
jgi:hypothetical protein